MPLEKLHHEGTRAWALWKISESEAELQEEVARYEIIPSALTNPIKRLEFVAGRVLVKHLMNVWGLNFTGIRKDEFGKPFPVNSTSQLSLSHSYPYIAALIDQDRPAGIDLEQPKPKLLKIAPRVLSHRELTDAGEDLTKHCVYWCAKEAMIKIYGKKDLILAENLAVEPFHLNRTGHILGRIIVRGNVTEVPLHYLVEKDFVLAFNR